MLLDKIKKISENFDEQEVLDKNNEIYVNVRKTVIQCGGETFYGYHITDISEYAMLIHEVSCYTNSVTNMSRFQSIIMKKLSMSYDTFLPGLADYCGSEEVVMFIKDKDKVIRSTYTDELVRVEVGNTDGYERFFSLARGKEAEGFFCILTMACGLGYGSGSYDYDELYAQADNLMYENKRELKAQKITSHIAE